MSDPQIRFAARHELEAALRVLLGTNRQFADVGVARQFIVDAQQRRLPLERVRIAVDRQHIVWATLALTSPGRTGIIMQPSLPLLPIDRSGRIAEIILQTCDDLRRQGVQLIQVLLDPADTAGERLHADCGFETLALLEYLRLPAKSGSIDFSPLTHHLAPEMNELEVALAASYVDTLDCPRLNGLRSMNDVIAGYRHAHPYNPELWSTLRRGDKPVGVLLLSLPASPEPLDISYLGLSPTDRGQGLGRKLVAYAQAIAAEQGREEVSVAVDSANTPAKRLYFGAGGKIVMTRRVMLKIC